MSEVTYYVALPFVQAEGGIVPGEAVECFNWNSAVMKPRCSRASQAMSARSTSAGPEIRPPAISGTPR
jgi:hypothetical protein